MRKANEQAVGGKGRIKDPHMLGSGYIDMNKTSFLFSTSSLASWVNRSKGGFLKEVRFGLSLEWAILEKPKMKEESCRRKVAAWKKR